MRPVDVLWWGFISPEVSFSPLCRGGEWVWSWDWLLIGHGGLYPVLVLASFHDDVWASDIEEDGAGVDASCFIHE